MTSFLCLTCGKVSGKEKACSCLADAGAAVAGEVSADGKYFVRVETQDMVDFLHSKMRHDIPLTATEQLFLLSQKGQP